MEYRITRWNCFFFWCWRRRRFWKVSQGKSSFAPFYVQAFYHAFISLLLTPSTDSWIREGGARFRIQKLTWHCRCHNVTTFLSDYLSCFLHSLPDRGCLKVGQKELNILLLLPPSHSIGFGEPSLLLMWANFTLGSKQRATVLQSKNSLCKTTWN